MKDRSPKGTHIGVGGTLPVGLLNNPGKDNLLEMINYKLPGIPGSLLLEIRTDRFNG